MTNNYTILFVIELLHEYFVDRKCQGLEIIPTVDCVALSKQLNIQYRFTGNKLIAFIRENGDNEPFMNSAAAKLFRKTHVQSKFRFYIRLSSPVFLNYSNLAYAFGSPGKFYVGNLAANDQHGNLYLSQPVPDFVAGQHYIPGDLVTDAETGGVFESIKKTTSKKNKLTDEEAWAPKGLLQGSKRVEEAQAGKTYASGDLVIKPGTNAVFEARKRTTIATLEDLHDDTMWWNREQGQLQYLSSADLIETYGNAYNFILNKPAKQLAIRILGFNYNSKKPAFDEQVRTVEERSYPAPARNVKIDLAGLPPGRYLIQVNDEERDIYYDPQAGNESIGIIEIFNHLDGKNAYSLLTSDEKIKHTCYQVQIANRRVLWKYTRKDGRAKAITDTGETNYVFKLEGEEFVSAAPIPLTESAVKTLKLDFHSRDFSMHPLPNPPVQQLGKYAQHDYDYLCTTLLLNY